MEVPESRLLLIAGARQRRFLLRIVESSLRQDAHIPAEAIDSGISRGLVSADQ